MKFTDKGCVYLNITVEGTVNERVVLQFSVSDTGVGIPESAQKDLFQPFTQADSSTTRKYGGSGLGLAICQRLVEMMGGTIAVNSSPGEGATFWFTVPFSIPDPDGTPLCNEFPMTSASEDTLS